MLKNNQTPLTSNIGHKEIIQQTYNNINSVKTQSQSTSASTSNNKNTMNLANTVMLSSLTSTLTSTSSF